MNLLDDDALERSSAVANCRMNRERRLAGYNRELGIDVVDTLRARRRAGEPVRWLDLCCGTGYALGQAADLLGGESDQSDQSDEGGEGDGGGEVEIVGVDLVDFFARAPCPPRLRLITAGTRRHRDDRPGHHALHGRGRPVLRPGRAHAPGPRTGARHTGAAHRRPARPPRRRLGPHAGGRLP